MEDGEEWYVEFGDPDYTEMCFRMFCVSCEEMLSYENPEGGPFRAMEVVAGFVQFVSLAHGFRVPDGLVVWMPMQDDNLFLSIPDAKITDFPPGFHKYKEQPYYTSASAGSAAAGSGATTSAGAT